MPSTKEWLSKPENQEKLRISRKNYKLRNPDAEKVRIAAKNKKFKNTHPDYFKDKHLVTKYGITYQDYIALYNNQEGKCVICEAFHPLESKVFTEILNVDHNHTTGQVRGLLCHKCNKALGLLQDNSRILQRAINYLEETSCPS